MPPPSHDAPQVVLEREDATRAIAGLVAGAAAGRGGCVVLESPAGMGKSRLLELGAAAADAAGVRVLHARGDLLEQSFAWGGALQLLGGAALGAVLPDAAGPAVALLSGDGLAASDDAEHLSFSLLFALTALIGALAQAAPLLLVVDDMQWVDAVTLRLLRYVLGRLDGLSTGLLLALRPGGDEPTAAALNAIATHPAASHESLAPLSSAAVTTLARTATDGRADAAFCARCSEVTGGNPFYLRELLRGVGTEPSAARLLDVASPTVARSVVARAAPIPGASTLLRALSIFGDGTPAAWVAALAGLELDATLEAADALATADLVVAGTMLRFTHDLVRASVQADTPPGWRSAAHARAAGIVRDGGGAVEAVAAHLLLAPSGAVDDAAALLRDAAARASARAAPQFAVAYLERALQEPLEPTLRLELRAELSSAAVAAGSPRAVDHLRELAADAPAGRRRAEALLRLGWALHVAGKPADSAQAFADGAHELGDAQPGDDLATELEVGELTAGMLDAGRAAAVHERLDRFVAGTSGTTAAGRHLRSQMLVLGLFSGETTASVLAADARELVHEAVERPDRFTSWTLWNAVGTLSWCDCFDEVLPLIDTVRARAEDSGSLVAIAMAAYARSWPALWTGRLVEATDDARLAADVWSSGAEGYLPAAVYWLVTGRLELGRVQEAEEALALIDPERWRTTAFHVFALAARARVEAARGEHEVALGTWQACGEHFVTQMHARNPTLVPWRSEAAELAVRTQDPDLALALAREDCERAERFGASRAMGEALRGLGLATGGEEGLLLLQQATAVLEPEWHLSRSYAKLEIPGRSGLAQLIAQARPEGA